MLQEHQVVLQVIVVMHQVQLILVMVVLVVVEVIQVDRPQLVVLEVVE
jgi:hypothetical protein